MVKSFGRKAVTHEEKFRRQMEEELEIEKKKLEIQKKRYEMGG